MSKHPLSPTPLPPAKRLHTISESNSRSLVQLTFDNALYDELILCIFSHLSWIDLCASQATSRNWSRLASDNGLWRNQFLQVFGQRLRGARGFRSDGRQVKSLPSRAKAEEFKDWKWMFRISSNWKKGRCLAEECPLPIAPTGLVSQTHILVLGNMTILAPAFEHPSPEVSLMTLTGQHHTLRCPSTRSNTPTQITALALDQSTLTSSHTRLACFISTGELSLFSISHTIPLTSRRELTYTPPRRTSRVSPIVQAVYHHPLLITLSESFSLSIYDLSSGNIILQHTLTSFTSYPPSCMVLSAPTNSAYKLVIAYAIPVYPAHWSVGVTELIITNHSGSEPTLSSSHYLSDIATIPPMSILSTRTARAVDVPQGWIDERKLRYMREQWSRKVSRIADTQTDGKWVVLAPDDSIHGRPTPSSTSSHLNSHTASSLYSPTSLQLYRLSLPQPSSVSSSPPKLTFVRTLNGQLGPIASLALADGRCVSLGLNGSIWVWDLEAGTGAEVAGPEFGLTYEDARILFTKPSVDFDDRRIITTAGDRVVVRSFDI